jgi:hypothetical protein
MMEFVYFVQRCSLCWSVLFQGPLSSRQATTSCLIFSRFLPQNFRNILLCGGAINAKLRSVLNFITHCMIHPRNENQAINQENEVTTQIQGARVLGRESPMSLNHKFEALDETWNSPPLGISHRSLDPWWSNSVKLVWYAYSR